MASCYECKILYITEKIKKVDFSSVTVDRKRREGGLISPCRWTSQSEIYSPQRQVKKPLHINWFFLFLNGIAFSLRIHLKNNILFLDEESNHHPKSSIESYPIHKSSFLQKFLFPFKWSYPSQYTTFIFYSFFYLFPKLSTLRKKIFTFFIY